MVEIRQTGTARPDHPRRRATPRIDEIRFRNPRVARVGIDVVDCRQLRTHAAQTLLAPQRPDFHLLWLVERGRGTHVVDFVEHALRPGTVVWVRAGQVQQWRMTERLDGRLVLALPAMATPPAGLGAGDARLLDVDDWPAIAHPPAALFREACDALTRMQRDLRGYDGSDVEAAVVRLSLLGLLLRLARVFASEAPSAAGARAQDAEVHRLFARELDRRVADRPTVAALARRIGYSESTLARACTAVTGLSAKSLVDRRVALEAKRLLLHGDASAADVGLRLGFSEPTNFAKFFRRMEGTTPQAFRAAARART
ncbi:MAG: AraC family transcriptional regulator [Burkholderiales bacterium]